MLKALARLPLYICKKWGLHLFMTGVFILLLLLVHRQVFAYFSNESRYQVDLTNFSAANLPEWLTDEDLAQSVTDSLQCSIQTHLFDDNLIPRLVAYYTSCPWVERVELIEKHLPNNLKIKLELRRPYVVVQQEQGLIVRHYLVDKDGTRLPGEYERIPDLPLILPVVVGVKNKPPLAGERWTDDGLTNAIAVTGILEDHKLKSAPLLGKIDVSNIHGRRNPKESEIVIWTQTNVPIQWGRAPDTDKFGELSVAEKINNLKFVLEVCPELKGLNYVKIQFNQPYIALQENQ